MKHTKSYLLLLKRFYEEGNMADVEYCAGQIARSNDPDIATFGASVCKIFVGKKYIPTGDKEADGFLESLSQFLLGNADSFSFVEKYSDTDLALAERYYDMIMRTAREEADKYLVPPEDEGKAVFVNLSEFYDE